MNTYNALVRSKLDYGSIIYDTAKPDLLNELSPIHNAGLRLTLGALCTSPVDSILNEAGQPHLHIRRKKLSLVTAAKLASSPENPAYDSTFQGDRKSVV